MKMRRSSIVADYRGGFEGKRDLCLCLSDVFKMTFDCEFGESANVIAVNNKMREKRAECGCQITL